MKLKALLSSIGILLGTGLAIAQNTGNEPADTLESPQFVLEAIPNEIDLNYDSWTQATSPAAIEQVRFPDFNQGLISDPSQLIQGRIAGAQIYNRGGNPNVLSLIRVRGLSSTTQRQPLFVIDGLAGASLEGLDPNDVASITVLKDGVGQALYGIRASNGVLLIKTKSAASFAGDTMIVSYTGQAANALGHPGIPVLDADAFRATGGVDLGASTNWLDEVSRTGFSQVHNLAVQGKKGRSFYRISANYRDVEGVLRNSGFEQLNLRVNLGSSFWQDKLKIQLSTAYTNRTSQLGFPEAFRYAVSYNPTAPVFAEGTSLPFSSTIFGGYFETIGLFDSFNPRALVDQNDRFSDHRMLQFTTSLQYEILPDLTLNFRYGHEDQFQNERAYYSPQSYFRGNAYTPLKDTRGRADLYDQDENFSLYELYANYQAQLGASSSVNFTVGTSYSDGGHEDLGYSLRGFANEELVQTDRISDVSNWGDEALTIDTTQNGWANKFSAVFSRMNFSVSDKFFLHASLRMEGSSRLGSDASWGVFPAFGAAYDLSKNMPNVQLFKFRLGYGLTGSVPDRAGLAKEFVDIRILSDGTSTSTVFREANPGLQSEEKSELNLGLDIQAGRWSGFAEWYSRDIRNWITEAPAMFAFQYINQNSFQTSGFELGLDVDLIQQTRLRYRTGLRLSTYRSEYKELDSDPTVIISSCCASSNPLVVATAGGEVGDIYGAVYAGIDETTGFTVYSDLNNDGLVVLDPTTLFMEQSDLTLLGNGIPNLELGWTHQFQFGSWELSAFFRGAFGHDLVNRHRQTFEAYYDLQLFNRINTELAIENLRPGRFADIFVESASFLKLDYLSLAKSFPLAKRNPNSQLRVSLTAQNILLTTSYTGADPEPAFEDIEEGLFGFEVDSRFRRSLAPGIDRRDYYLPSNTYTLGVVVVF